MAENGVAVRFEPCPEGNPWDGIHEEGLIRVCQHGRPLYELQVLVHEIGHELQARDGTLGNPDAQVEADLVSFLVLRELGYLLPASSFVFLGTAPPTSLARVRRHADAMANKVSAALDYWQWGRW
jgi:hypothetical protein